MIVLEKLKYKIKRVEKMTNPKVNMTLHFSYSIFLAENFIFFSDSPIFYVHICWRLIGLSYEIRHPISIHCHSWNNYTKSVAAICCTFRLRISQFYRFVIFNVHCLAGHICSAHTPVISALLYMFNVMHSINRSVGSFFHFFAVEL